MTSMFLRRMALLMLAGLLGCATTREKADTAYMREDWDAAAVGYQRAVGDARTPQDVQYLKTRLADSRGRAAASHLEKARTYGNVGDTRQAALHAEKAVEFGGGSEAEVMFASLRSSEGNGFLTEGRAAHRDGRWTDAVTALGKAQQWAPSDEGARLLSESEGQVQRLKPADYRITIHSAVILPFKPQDKRPWDGFGGPIPGAQDMLRSLASSATDPTGLTAVITASRLLSAATAKPDCYAVVSVSGQPVTLARQNTQRDTLEPVWNIPFQVSDANYQDARVVSITVVDEDLETDDTIGNHQVTVGDLVRAPTQELSLISREETLSAGGIVLLRLSAEKI